jgi:hypothetical protein
VCGRPRALDREIVFALIALIDEERHAAFGAVNENDGYRAVREVASSRPGTHKASKTKTKAVCSSLKWNRGPIGFSGENANPPRRTTRPSMRRLYHDQLPLRPTEAQHPRAAELLEMSRLLDGIRETLTAVRHDLAQDG